MQSVTDAVEASGGALRRGARGDAVKAVQAAIRQHNIPVVVDGVFGDDTAKAVRQFQRIAGLADDGVVGRRTAAALDVPPMPERDETPVAPAPATGRAVWPRQSEVRRFYGEPGANQTMLELPFPMRLAWQKNTAVRRFSIHEKVADSARRCFERIGQAYDADARRDLGIDLFGGCLNVRPMRGGTRLSMHSWGIAIDFDPARNQLRWGRDRARLAQPDAEAFWRIWESEGWVSLGSARNYDWMHVQAARL